MLLYSKKSLKKAQGFTILHVPFDDKILRGSIEQKFRDNTCLNCYRRVKARRSFRNLVNKTMDTIIDV